LVLSVRVKFHVFMFKLLRNKLITGWTVVQAMC